MTTTDYFNKITLNLPNKKLINNPPNNLLNKLPNNLLNKLPNNLSNNFTKFHILIIILGSILIFAIAHRISETKFEAFTQKEKYVYKKGTEIYDKFYCSIYDDLFFYDPLHFFHCEQVENLIPTKHKAVMLDVGSGTGHFVDNFCRKKINIIGIDKSHHMVKLAKKTFPKCDFETINALSAIMFDHNYFTHITCLYFTIYYIKNKTLFFQNCYTWLKPNGLLILHLVNREMFDPIIPAGDPLVLISSQKYAKKRITKTAIKFKNFNYKSKFSLNNETDIATLTEDFKDDKTGNKRQNEHVLYMEEQKEIIYLALSAGFKLEAKIDMLECQYEYQYLYILRKI